MKEIGPYLGTNTDTRGKARVHMESNAW